MAEFREKEAEKETAEFLAAYEAADVNVGDVFIADYESSKVLRISKSKVQFTTNTLTKADVGRRILNGYWRRKGDND